VAQLANLILSAISDGEESNYQYNMEIDNNPRISGASRFVVIKSNNLMNNTSALIPPPSHLYFQSFRFKISKISKIGNQGVKVPNLMQPNFLTLAICITIYVLC